MNEIISSSENDSGNGIEIKTYSEHCPFLFFLQYFLISVCFVILSSPAVANDAWDRLLPPPPEQCSAILFVCLTSNTLFVCLFVPQVKLVFIFLPNQIFQPI